MFNFLPILTLPVFFYFKFENFGKIEKDPKTVLKNSATASLRIQAFF